MFTGIVQHVGRVKSVVQRESGVLLRIDGGSWHHAPIPGDSIAVNGVCLTIVLPPGQRNTLTFDVVPETLARTNLGMIHERDPVNLEHAVTPHTLMGGHIVQGHIDGVGEVVSASTDGEYRLRVRVPNEMMLSIVEKGSIAIDGVSLTVASTDEDWFEVALIPTTLQQTTLGRASVGTRVNVETDYVAKIVCNWLRRAGHLGAVSKARA